MVTPTGRYSTWIETEEDREVARAVAEQLHKVISLLSDGREYVVRRHPAYWKGGRCRLVVDVVLLCPKEAGVGEIVAYHRLWRKPCARFVEYHVYDEDEKVVRAVYRFVEKADHEDPFYAEALVGWERV